jgi:hypothetical protein
MHESACSVVIIRRLGLVYGSTFAALGAQPSLDTVVPGSIQVRPICSHSLENRSPEAEIRGAVGFSLDRRQAGLTGQRLGRKQLSKFTET